MNDEVVVLKKTWVAMVLNALFPGAGYLYVGNSRPWSIVLIVVFSALSYQLFVLSSGWFILSLWARVVFAVHAGFGATSYNRNQIDPSRHAGSTDPHGSQRPQPPNQWFMR